MAEIEGDVVGDAANSSVNDVMPQAAGENAPVASEAHIGERTTEDRSTPEGEPPPEAAAEGGAKKQGKRQKSAKRASEADEAPEAPIDVSSLCLAPELVAQTQAVVERRRVIDELIAAAEGHRGSVTEEVYRRVLTDYQERLAGVAEEFAPLRGRVREELERIRKEERRLRQELERVNRDLEEIRFRCTVGEFDADEMGRRTGEQEQDVQRLKLQLETIEATCETARGLVGEDTVGQAAVGEAAPEEAGATQQGVAKVVAKGQVKGSEKAKADKALPEPPSPEPPPAPAGDDGLVGATRILPRALLTKVSPGTAQSVEVGLKGLTLGRDPSNDVIINGATISRHHATISFEQDAFFITDVSSGGGVVVNGERKQKARLRFGDQITIGTTALLFDRP